MYCDVIISVMHIMAQYSSGFLRIIRKISWTDYRNFQLDNITKSRVISLGIRKHPAPEEKQFVTEDPEQDINFSIRFTHWCHGYTT